MISNRKSVASKRDLTYFISSFFSLCFLCLVSQIYLLLPSSRDEHRGQVKTFKSPLEVISPLNPALFLELFLYEMLLCDLATPQHPSSLVPSPPRVLIAKYLSRLRTFLSICLFFAPRRGQKSLSFEGVQLPAHACLRGEWFTDVYQEWIDQRQSHDRRSIKHQIKDGNPRAEHKLKIRHFSLFLSLFLLAPAHQTR